MKTKEKLKNPKIQLTREEIKIIKIWFQKTLNQLKNTVFENFKEREEQEQIVLDLTYQNLLQSLKSECIQKGEIFELLWQQQKIHNQKYNDLKKYEKMFEASNKDLDNRQIYYDQLEEKEQMVQTIQKLEKIILEKEKEIKEQDQLLQSYVKKNDQQNYQTNSQQKIIQALDKKCKIILEEFRQMKKKYKLLASQNNNFRNEYLRGLKNENYEIQNLELNAENLNQIDKSLDEDTINPDLLNLVDINMDKIVKMEEKETQYDVYYTQLYQGIQDVQTDLQLIDPQYDQICQTQDIFEEATADLKFKYEINQINQDKNDDEKEKIQLTQENINNDNLSVQKDEILELIKNYENLSQTNQISQKSQTNDNLEISQKQLQNYQIQQQNQYYFPSELHQSRYNLNQFKRRLSTEILLNYQQKQENNLFYLLKQDKYIPIHKIRQQNEQVDKSQKLKYLSSYYDIENMEQQVEGISDSDLQDEISESGIQIQQQSQQQIEKSNSKKSKLKQVVESLKNSKSLNQNNNINNEKKNRDYPSQHEKKIYLKNKVIQAFQVQKLKNDDISQKLKQVMLKLKQINHEQDESKNQHNSLKEQMEQKISQKDELIQDLQQKLEKQKEEFQKDRNKLQSLLTHQQILLQQEKEEQLKKQEEDEQNKSLQQFRRASSKLLGINMLGKKKNKKKYTKFSKMPKLGQIKQNTQNNFAKQLEVAKDIIQKVKDKKFTKFNNYMSLKTVLKLIFQFYNERIQLSKQDSSVSNMDFGIFCFKQMLSQFGIKKIAEQKFQIFCLSIKKHFATFRVNLFAKFLGLFDEQINHSPEALNKYLDLLNHIINVSTQGQFALSNELASEAVLLVPYVRALSAVQKFCEQGSYSREEQTALKKQVESMKDAKNRVDFDQFAAGVLVEYKMLIGRAQIYVKNAFVASDLDGDGMCSLQEWLILNRNLEPEKNQEEFLEQKFYEYADLEDDSGEKNLSFNKFSVLCVELSIFSDISQNKFLNLDLDQNIDQQIEAQFEQLKQIWVEKKGEISNRIQNIPGIEMEEINQWQDQINSLDKNIQLFEENKQNLDQNTENTRVIQLKPLLLAYEILQKESKGLEQEYLQTQNDESQNQSFNNTINSNLNNNMTNQPLNTQGIDDENSSEYNDNNNSGSKQKQKLQKFFVIQEEI